MLGKRPRPATKRTASMSDVTFNLNAVQVDAPQVQQHHRDTSDESKKPASGGTHQVAAASGLLLDQWLLKRNLSPPPAPANLCRRQSADSLTSHFLQSCRLCSDRLVPGRDIYMYRGDSAFCSEECRQQQMIQDERKEKYLKIKSKKLAPTSSSAAAATAVSESVATV